MNLDSDILVIVHLKQTKNEPAKVAFFCYTEKT